MPRSYSLFALLLIMSILASCSKSSEHVYDYNKSYKAWQRFKDSSGNSYRYMAVTSSWTGFSTETIITVKQGKVVQRAFVAKKYANNGTNQAVITDEWTEEADQLNTHSDGARTLTLDEIYKQAKTDWLKKRDGGSTYFETNNNGMISSCGYIFGYCADDCFTGINIRYIMAI